MLSNLFTKLASVADVYDAGAHISVGQDPLTWRAYQSFARGLREQYARILAKGIVVRQTAVDPGADSRALFDNIDGGYLFVFNGADLPPAHALAADSRIDIVGDSGWHERATLNTVFRVCHDYYGHYASGARNTFSAAGETAAFLCHAAMFERAALPALACETICQVAWFYAGAHIRRPDGSIPSPAAEDFTPLPVRPFAPQKNSIGAGSFASDVFLNRGRFGATIKELAYAQKATCEAAILSV